MACILYLWWVSIQTSHIQGFNNHMRIVASIPDSKGLVQDCVWSACVECGVSGACHRQYTSCPDLVFCVGGKRSVSPGMQGVLFFSSRLPLRTGKPARPTSGWLKEHLWTKWPIWSCCFFFFKKEVVGRQVKKRRGSRRRRKPCKLQNTLTCGQMKQILYLVHRLVLGSVLEGRIPKKQWEVQSHSSI